MENAYFLRGEKMLSKKFIEFLFEGAHIQRWNDHIRPNGFTELDKQAHKMMILYILAKYEEQDHGAKLNWRVLIEGGIFEFMHRIILTDIKPPIYHELMRVHGRKLNAWIYSQLERHVPELDEVFFDKLKRWFDYPEENRLEKNFCGRHTTLPRSGNLALSTILTRQFTALMPLKLPLKAISRTITIWPAFRKYR